MANDTKPPGRLASACAVVFSLLLVLWCVEVVDHLVPALDLDQQWGLKPLTKEGLLGILTAPFLHDGWGHLLANTISFTIVGMLALLVDRRQAIEAMIAAIVLGGLFTWVVAGLAEQSAVHIGFSGVIFGLCGLVIANGLALRNLGAVAAAVVVVLVFGGGLLWGLLPQPSSKVAISWQMHLGGFLSGVLVSLAHKPKAKGGSSAA